MQIKEVDCRGLACPLPVLQTKKALEEIPSGKVVVTVDNAAARENITMMAANAGYPVQVEERAGNYLITITKEGGKGTEASPQVQGNTTGRPLTYFFTSNLFGQGAPELGLVLIKSLFTTLAAMDPPPDNLIFINSGVFLTCAGSPLLEPLQQMAARGTRILSCGTCLEYYQLKEKLCAGNISNMHEINAILSGPGKVVNIP